MVGYIISLAMRTEHLYGKPKKYKKQRRRAAVARRAHNP